MKTTPFEPHAVLHENNICCNGSQFPKNESEDLSTYHNKEYILQDVKHSWYEKVNDEVVLVMYVPDLIAKNVRVAFEECRLHVHFKTGDEKFHKQCETSTDTVFHWPLNLSNKIIANACTYNIKLKSLEINLKKENNAKWTTITEPNLPASVSRNNIVGGARIAAKEVEKSWNLSSGPTRPPEQKQENLIPSAATFSHPSSSSYTSTTASSHDQQQVRKLKLGYTGLDNLGNTCFMNSVLQALANTRELRDYFLGPLYKVDINCENPLGSGGRLAHAFHLLLKNVWSGETSTFAPAKLKNIVASRASQFTGFMQHDAQEFMAFLLDGLHEDVNRVKSKPYFEIKEYPGQPDHTVAQEAWGLHKSRNDSFIVDKFHGQYKSKLICPECGKESVTFDPFLFLPVPLPKPTKRLSVIFLPMQPSSRPIEMNVHVSKESGDVSEVLMLIAQKMSRSPDNFVMFESLRGEIYRIFSMNMPTYHMTSNDLIIVCEVQSKKKSTEPVFHVPVMQQLTIPILTGSCAKCHRSAETADVKIRRCTQCRRVGYCNQECQKAHWQEHKKECKKIPEAIGTPFIVSIAASKATYNNLWKLILDYARLSVDITYKANCSGSSPAEDGEKIDNFDDNGNPIDSPTKSFDDFVPFHIFSSETRRNINEIQCEFTNTGDELLEWGNVKQLTIRWKNNCKDDQYVAVRSIPIKCQPSINVGTRNTGDSSKLQECIQLFTEPEILAAQEAWYCPQCKKHREASKQLSLWQLPDILIIQLKRFSFKDTIWRHKIDRLVEFPVRGLDMQPFCVNIDPSAPPVYDLFAVINHHGGIFGGHYTSYVRLPDVEDSRKSTIGWRLCDDNRVTKVHSEEQVITKAAYVMFYHRRKSYHCGIGIPRAKINSQDNGDDCDEEDAESSFGKESRASTKDEDEYFSAAETFNDVRYSNEDMSLADMGATGGKSPVDTFFPTSSVFEGTQQMLPDYVFDCPLTKETFEESDNSSSLSQDSQDKSPVDLQSTEPSAEYVAGSSSPQIKTYDTESELDDESPSPIASDVQITLNNKDANYFSSIAENICIESSDLGYTDMDSID